MRGPYLRYMMNRNRHMRGVLNIYDEPESPSDGGVLNRYDERENHTRGVLKI